MTTPRDVLAKIEEMVGHPIRGEEGILHGPEDREVSGVTVAWLCSPDAIAAAGETGHEMLISHESLTYPYDAYRRPDAHPEGWRDWAVNRNRRELLDKHGLTLARVHTCADELCILDVFAERLGLGDPVHADWPVKVYEIEPVSVADLVARVKECIGMPHVRVAHVGSRERMVHRIGLPWGGVGLFVNVSYQQKLVELGCDAFIAGESDSYGFRFAVENDIPMIETSHEDSENAGLAEFTRRLAEAMPDLDFAFYENPCVWRIE